MVITTKTNDIKERLSLAFLTAVASRSGCQVDLPQIDRMSVDATISPIRGAKVKLDVQLKATSHIETIDEQVVYDLPVSNYNHLRSTEVECAQLLVIVNLASEEAKWLEMKEEELILRHTAYWRSLYGEGPTQNTSTIRVAIPRSQLFTPRTLEELIGRSYERLRAGEGGI